MCGLAGILKRNGNLDLNTKTLLHNMGRQIIHRGPDDTQIVLERTYGAVFNRLSIVDLAGGRQPLFNEDKSLLLLVNGEIYNHKSLRASLKEDHYFQTQSDCEIILHLYEEHGLDFLTMLNGMFALSLWDKRQQRLILARDRLGIKPLYYTYSAERLLFGSEIKALLAYPDCPAQFNWAEALSHAYTVVNAHDGLPSFFEDIHYLPGGSLLIANMHENSIQVKPYWQAVRPAAEEYAADTRSAETIIAGYGELLADAVKLRLMADVEVGLFLSGGIDSVSIAALLAPYQKLHTFSVLSQSTFQNGDAQAGHSAASYLGLPNHQVLYSWHDNPFTPDHWRDLLWLCETPLCGAEQLYKYYLHQYAKQQRPGLKVILLGQGSDEFNGGYATDYIKGYSPDLPESEKNWSAFMAIFNHLERQAIVGGWRLNLAQPETLLNKDFLASCSRQKGYDHPWLYHFAMYRQSLQVYNLWHEDRTAAGNHIENRVPFLDHRLVEYTLRIPPAKYEAMFWDKQILRQAMTSKLPLDLINRPKVPFFHGDDVRYTYRMMFNLLLADNRALIKEAFGDADGSHPVFERQMIEQLITEIPEDPEYGDVASLLQVTNMGLLAKMAQDVSASGSDIKPLLVLPHVPIENWEAQEDEIALQLAIRRQTIDLDRPLTFAANTVLLKVDNLAEEGPCSYISVDNALEYELDETEMADWLAVLRRIDGERSLNNILSELNMSVSKIQKYLEEAFDYELIYFE